MNNSRLAHFLMLARSSERILAEVPDVAPTINLRLSESLDLASSLPETVKSADRAADTYRYLNVFENFLRDLIRTTLAENNPTDWWETKVSQNVQTEVATSLQNEETKTWMSMAKRERIALTTYPQLFTIIEHCWKSDFEQIIKDKHLLQEARHITHLRNAICHMSDIPDEEVDRVKQVLRDWFRIVTP